MAKDPAVLFYTSDFISGTSFFTDEQCGQYIRLLCHQHQLGHIPEQHMLNICKTYDNPVWSKFIKDAQGLWYQERMDIEKQKRIKYCESRRNNKMKEYDSEHMSKHMTKHMSTHMENENGNRNVVIKEKMLRSAKESANFDFKVLWDRYPKKLGHKAAERHFRASVKTQVDFDAIKTALDVFLGSRIARGDPQYIPHGSTWFNNWRDWLNYNDNPENEIESKIYRKDEK